MTPFIQEGYNKITCNRNTNNNELSRMKSDKSIFTFIDGAVQQLLRTTIFTNKQVKNFVGEESEIDANSSIPLDFQESFNKTKIELSNLQKKMPLIAKTLTVFLDPIDGTAEFRCFDKKNK